MSDGGPAFPGFDFVTQDGRNNPLGMSLRDYFAAKAMAAMTPDEIEIDLVSDAEIARASSRIAKISYKFADAMLKAREVT